MSITAVCECGKKFEAKDEYEGRRAICPSCRREFVFQRHGIPVFHEVIEPPPLPPVRGADNHDEEPEPPPAGAAEAGRPFWKDPIIIVGAVIPVTILAVFFGYLFYEHRTKEFHRRVYALKLEVDDLVKSGQSRAALDKCEEVLSAIGDPAAADVKMRGYADVVSKTRDRLNDAVQAEKKHEKSDRTWESSKTWRNAKIPIEVSYPVMHEQRVPPRYRSVDIVINMKVPKEILREIALEMKAKEFEQYEGTFVYFYLPKYWDGKDDWATAFFNPTLEVEILGLEEGKDRVLAGLKVTLPENSTLIGSWISQEESYLISIYEKGSEYYMIRSYPDRKSIVEFYKVPSIDEPTFTFYPNDERGLKFQVSKSGNLFKYNQNIMKSIAEPVKNFQVDVSEK
jgi:hypothetical protein